MKSILIIDDEILIAKAIEKVFRKSGFDVQTANNASDGIKKFRENSFDFALIDFLMPDLSGRDVIEAMNQTDRKTKKFIMTAYSDEALNKDLISLGVLKIIKKPFDNIFDLVEILESH